MGKASYKLIKSVGKEQAELQRKSSKRGLWGSLGAALGTLIAVGLTGGAAAPIVAGLFAGAGSYAGGKIGDIAAKGGWFNTEKAKIEGEGQWLKGERSGAVSSLQEGNISRAFKTGLKVVGAKMLGKGMEAMKTAKAGAAAGETTTKFKPMEALFKGGDKGTQTGLGKLLDIKGSPLAKGMKSLSALPEKLASSKMEKLARKGLITESGEIISTGKVPELSASLRGASDLDTLWREEMRMPATEGYDDLDIFRAKAGQVDPIDIDFSRRGQWGKSQWDAYRSGDYLKGIPSGPLKDLSAGHLKDLEQITPAGQMPTDFPTDQVLSEEELDIKRFYESQGPIDSSTYISRQMPKHTSMQDVAIGENFYESSNIRNTPQYVAGKHAERSYFSNMLDLDKDLPLDMRQNIPTEYPISKADVSLFDASEAQQSAIISGGLENYEFGGSYLTEGMRADPLAPTQIPFSGGPGIDQTGTAAWEGVGQTFPVSSPDLVQNIGPASEFNVASPDLVSPVGQVPGSPLQRVSGLQGSAPWQKRLFGR